MKKIYLVMGVLNMKVKIKEFVKQVRDNHPYKIAFLFCDIQKGQEFCFGKQNRLSTDKVGTKGKSALVPNIDDKSCRVAIRDE